MTQTARLLEDSLLVIWNDRDGGRRLAAMQNTYAPDIRFFESDGSEPIVGHQAINDLIDTLQSQWPVEFRFELSKPAAANHHTQVASWTLGPQGGQPVASGMDVALIEKDRIQSLYLFLDAPPQP